MKEGRKKKKKKKAVSTYTFPVLAEFLKNEAQFRALRHLPAVLDWVALLHARYDRRVTRASVRAGGGRSGCITAGAAIAGAPPGERARWAAAFAGFAAAWRMAGRHARMYGCLTIPKTYHDVVIGSDTPLGFSLPGEKDEGILPLALAQFLGERHNALVQAAEDYRRHHRKRKQRRAGGDGDNKRSKRREAAEERAQRAAIVSSRRFRAAHALSYDLDRFAAFVESQCVGGAGGGGGGGGGREYDFHAAEAFLVRGWLSAKPRIELAVPLVNFVGEGGLERDVQALGRKCAQEPLPAGVEQALRAQLGGRPAAARRCLGTVETVVRFLSAALTAAHANLGDVSLSGYAASVLHLDGGTGGGGGGSGGGGADVWGGASVVAEGRVLIKHVDALCAALRTCTDTDQFAGVQAKYRRPLDEGGAAALRAAVDAGLDAEALVPVLLAFVSQQLKEDFIGADKPIKEVVGFLDDGHDAFLVDLPWFAHFPGALQMRHVVAAYEELKKLV